MNVTVVAPVSRFPVMVTDVPTTPVDGAKEVIEGVVTCGGGGVPPPPPPQEAIENIRLIAIVERRSRFRIGV